MKYHTVDKNTALHYTWGSYCDSWVLVDTEGLSVKQESIPVGACEQLHFHNHAQQFFFVLKGTATFYIAKDKIIATEQKGVFIHPGTKHFIANESTAQLDFLVISQPTTNNDRVLVK